MGRRRERRRAGRLARRTRTGPSAALQRDKKTPAEVAGLRLQKAWLAHLTGEAPAVPLDLVPQPQVLEFAQKSKTPYSDPPEMRSQNGVLTATLTVAKSHLTVGTDKVFLRTYNERLVGPTFPSSRATPSRSR